MRRGIVRGFFLFPIKSNNFCLLFLLTYFVSVELQGGITLNFNGFSEKINLDDLEEYCRFTFIKITYSGWIEDDYIEKNIIVLMN